MLTVSRENAKIGFAMAIDKQKEHQQFLPLNDKVTFDYHSLFNISDVPEPALKTSLGVLFNSDCLKILPLVRDETVDTIFADPPFNLGKEYDSSFNDSLPPNQYLTWCEEWIVHCLRVLKPGGSFFIYNLPKWNISLGSFLMQSGMNFCDWIAVSIKFSLPIPRRLYPSHYSLLYFSKGKPKTYHQIRTPIETCRHCGGEIKDYGGYRNKMNGNGVNLTDVWCDIPPVRHSKFKSDKRVANQLSTKLLERVINISTNKGDLVLDPFGGSGTTYDVCERKGRHWIGIELYNTEVIVERLLAGNIAPHKNTDYVDEG